MGGIGLEPTTSCVSSRKVTRKYLFYNDLYSNYTPLHKKYTQSTHRDHWEYTQNPLVRYALLPLRGVGE